MNIMLVSTTERTREIGIRMAVGPGKKDILFQFPTEATVLSSIGGIVGVILGVVLSKLISYYGEWPSLLSPLSVAVAFLFEYSRHLLVIIRHGRRQGSIRLMRSGMNSMKKTPLQKHVYQAARLSKTVPV